MPSLPSLFNLLSSLPSLHARASRVHGPIEQFAQNDVFLGSLSLRLHFRPCVEQSGHRREEFSFLFSVFGSFFSSPCGLDVQVNAAAFISTGALIGRSPTANHHTSSSVCPSLPTSFAMASSLSHRFATRLNQLVNASSITRVTITFKLCRSQPYPLALYGSL